LIKSVVDHVLIEAQEDEPHHAPQLRATLLTFLERTGASPEDSQVLPLEELVRRGVEYLGFTR
jgi:hypothetical protein